MVIGYIGLFILSYVTEFGLSVKMTIDFHNKLFDEGYKINNKYHNKLMKAKYKIKPNIIDFVPGLNVIQLFFKLNNMLKKMRKDPAFINNLDRVTELDKLYVDSFEKENNKSLFMRNMKRGVIIIGLSNDANVRYEGVNLGSYTAEELKENDGMLSDEVLEKMESLDEVIKNNEGRETEQAFYVLPGEYTMSNVFRIDEDATFIKTHEDTNVAIIGATKNEINEFLRRSLIVKPQLDKTYRVISIKPFDKDLVRRALVEMEYFNNPIDLEIDEGTLRDEVKKRTL